MIPSKWVIDRIAGDANSFFSKTAGLVGLSLLHWRKQGYESCRFPLFHPLFLTSRFKHLTNRLNRKVIAVFFFFWILMQVRTPYTTYICTTTYYGVLCTPYDGNSDLHLDPLISVRSTACPNFGVRTLYGVLLHLQSWSTLKMSVPLVRSIHAAYFCTSCTGPRKQE